jgi:tRNA dimethylallyltransferase
VSVDVIVIGGPTASGKTALGIALAERLNGEIVGADSRQIYAGMPIGTAAPVAADLARVRHHLVGFLDPHERYSAARFVEEAAAVIDDIIARGKRPIVVGGTGFYLRALCGDVVLGHAPDTGARARLAREVLVHPPDVLHAWLATLDPVRAADVPAGDGYRIARALEIAFARRAEAAAPRRALPTLRARGRSFVKLVTTRTADELHALIARRTDAMLAAGFIEEAERIGAAAVAADAVGYRDALAYLAGQMTYDDLRNVLARSTRRYAKRQQTWFRSEPGVRRIELSAAPLASIVDNITSSLLDARPNGE